MEPEGSPEGQAGSLQRGGQKLEHTELVVGGLAKLPQLSGVRLTPLHSYSSFELHLDPFVWDPPDPLRKVCGFKQLQ